MPWNGACSLFSARMNQHEFLEHLWWSVIDHEDQASANATSLDLRHVARYARYGAVFDWCAAFDEAGLLPAQWLDAEHRPRWEALADAGSLEIPATARRRRPRDDGPFADADSAMDRLLASGASRSELASVVDRARRDALSATLGALRAQSFGPDDLAGLHESLLSADPSGMEARPGSWPPEVRPRAARPKSDAPAPLVKLRVSHELAFSPDGSRIVAAAGGVITDIASREPLATCAVLANTAHVAWSPDGRWIAATNTAGKIALCDAATGARKHVLAMTAEGAGAAFSADGALVYCGDWKGNLFAWDAATGRELQRVTLAGAMIRGIDWSRAHEGLDVLVSHRPKPIVLFALSADLDEREPRIELPDRTGEVVREVGGTRALIAGYGFIARIDLTTGAITERHEVPQASRLSCSPDGRWCAVTHGGGFRIGLTADLSHATEVAMQYASNRAAFSPDSRRIALATWNAGEVWEIDRLVRA